jgi:hypothetical protein
MNKNEIETLLNIMDMGNQHNNASEERNWLFRVLHAIPAKNTLNTFACKWIQIIKDRWAYESEYFTIRNDIRTEATKLVKELAAGELERLHKRKKSLETELSNVNKRLNRFEKWR